MSDTDYPDQDSSDDLSDQPVTGLIIPGLNPNDFIATYAIDPTGAGDTFIVVLKKRNAPIQPATNQQTKVAVNSLLANILSVDPDEVFSDFDEGDDPFPEDDEENTEGLPISEAIALIVAKCGTFDLNGPFTEYEDADNYSRAIAVSAISEIGYQFDRRGNAEYYIVIGCSS